MGLTDIYMLSPTNTTEYILFPGAHGTFSKIDQIVGYEASPTNF